MYTYIFFPLSNINLKVLGSIGSTNKFQFAMCKQPIPVSLVEHGVCTDLDFLNQIPTITELGLVDWCTHYQILNWAINLNGN